MQEKKKNKILRNLKEVEIKWNVFIFLLLLAMRTGYEGKGFCCERKKRQK